MSNEKFTYEDFNLEFCQRLVRDHATIEDAAFAIAPSCWSTTTKATPAVNTVRGWISRHVGPRRKARLLDPANQEHRNRVEKLFTEFSVDPNAVKITGGTFGTHAGYIKNAEGEIETVPMWSQKVKWSVENPEDAPQPVLPAASTVVFYQPPTDIYILRKIRTVVIWSDAQIGHLRRSDDTLESIHDPHAIDLALQITADVAPDEIGWIGDWLDLPSLSKYEQPREYERTLQSAIDEGHRLLCEAISAAGEQCKRRVFIGGNHDARFEKSVIKYNRDLVGLRPANTDPNDWGVLSVPSLLHFKSLGIEFPGHYPGGEWWLTSDLVAVHAPPKPHEFAASVIHGHTHKLTRTPYVAHRSNGRHEMFLYDIGCLCKTGKTDDPQRTMVTQTPSDRGRTNWQQGIGYVEIIDGEVPRHQVSQIHFFPGGTTTWAGKQYRSSFLRDTEDAA